MLFDPIPLPLHRHGFVDPTTPERLRRGHYILDPLQPVGHCDGTTRLLQHELWRLHQGGIRLYMHYLNAAGLN